VLGVLQVALGHHDIAGGMGVAGQLHVFLGDVGGGAAHLHVRPVRFKGARQGVGAAPVVVPAPHAVLLSHSHRIILLDRKLSCAGSLSAMPAATAGTGPEKSRFSSARGPGGTGATGRAMETCCGFRPCAQKLRKS
jgi:hypothetical protein